MPLSADLVRLAFVPEDAYGVTPANPAFQVMRITGESVNFAPTTTNSNEMNPNRGVTDLILTGGSVSGDIPFELAYEHWFNLFLAMAMCNTWENDSIQVGKKLLSATLEKYLPVDPDITELYHRVPGTIVDGFSINIAPNAVITGTFSVLGKSMDPDEAPLAGATYRDPAYNPVMAAPTVTDITLAGVVATTECFSNMVINLANNNRAVECIGFLGAKEMVLGRAEVSLNFSLYFSDNDLLQMLLDQEAIAISFKLQDTAEPANWYEFAFPRVKLSQANADATGTGADVVYEAVGQALLDPVTGTQMIITRSPEPFMPAVTTIDAVVVTDNAAADGVAVNTVRFTARDQNGDPMAGVALTFSVDKGTALPAPVNANTAADGTATVNVTDTVVEVVNVTATYNLVQKAQAVSFV